MKQLLDEMINYIEETDQQIEWERGSGRSLDEVKAAKDMPDIYYKLISIRRDQEDLRSEIKKKVADIESETDNALDMMLDILHLLKNI
jgi:hypothetical protein